MQTTEKQARGNRYYRDFIHNFTDTSRSRTVHMGVWYSDRVGIDVFKRTMGLKNKEEKWKK
jgi:ACT domain-containing protein